MRPDGVVVDGMGYKRDGSLIDFIAVYTERFKNRRGKQFILII
jgi:hypothetical protein